MKKLKLTRNFPSTNKSLQHLLQKFLSQIQTSEESEKERVFKLWFAILGDEFSKYTKPLSFDKGIFIVRVESSSLYSLLCTYEKTRLYQELRKHVPHLRDIRFRFC